MINQHELEFLKNKIDSVFCAPRQFIFAYRATRTPHRINRYRDKCPSQLNS